MTALTYALGIMILLLLILVPSILFAGEIRDIYLQTTKKSVCKTSVVAHSALCLKDLPPAEIRCPTINLRIEGKNTEKIKKSMAKSLFDCWDQFGRGENEICGQQGIYCTICHQITFEDKNLKIDGFPEYLATNQAPGTTATYFDFLNGGNIQKNELTTQAENLRSETVLDTSVEDNYATIFVQIKDRNEVQNFLTKSQSTLPGLGIVAVGAGAMKLGLATTGLSWWTGIGAVGGITLTVTGGLLVIGGTTLSTAMAYFTEQPFDTISYVHFGPYNVETLQNLGCTQLPASQST